MVLLASCGQPSSPPAATDSAASPPATVAANPSPSGPQSAPAKTAPGTGNLEGEVRWNSQGAANLEVKLCQNVSSFSGCSGKELLTKTDAKGKYRFANAPVGDYALLIRVFDTDGWIFPAEGIAGLNSKKFKVTEGQTLTLTTQNIYKDDLQLKAPAEDAQLSSAQPTLQWATYPQAAYYKLYLSAQDNSPPYEDSIVNRRVDTNQLALEKPLTKCNYTWRVQAFNGEGVKIAENDRYAKFSIKTCKKS